MKQVIQAIGVTGLSQSSEGQKEGGAMHSQNAADQLREEGWKQGCLIHPDKAENITIASIDFYDNTVSSEIWLVVLTQDCDLVRHTNVEPYVEMLAIQKLSNIPNKAARGQSARTLHLNFEINGERHWFECNIHNRFRIRKESLCGLGGDTSLRVEEDEHRLLRQWLARRYTRAAFPDYFEKHLASTKDPIKKLFKSSGAKLISTIYIAIDNEDASSEDDYLIRVILAVLSEDRQDSEKSQIIDDFEDKFIDAFSRRPHIRFALKYPDDETSFDVNVLPEDDITLSTLRKYKRFDVDYRSLEDDTVAPPNSLDEN